METCEPRQVRKEATVSRQIHVPQGSLARANCPGNACSFDSSQGARPINIKKRSENNSMSYVALYRKWRPQIFEDVVEQEHVVNTLKQAVSTDRIAHAYLFCGTRGTGKTSIAHIFSRAINCLAPVQGNPCNKCEICKGILSGSIMDVIEIDAASNNSVDDVRQIRDEVIYSPSKAKFKVYIIDEVHMLSSGAFNALLKTLEEPPQNVVFILATTEPHKLPATILSRCQRYDFKRITKKSIAERLKHIADSSGVQLSPDALNLLARLSDGAMRDAISLLDQCIATGKTVINYDDVLLIVGIVKDTLLVNTVDTIIEGSVSKVLSLIENIVMEGKEIPQFVSDLTEYYRNLLVCKTVDNPLEILQVSEEMLKDLKRQADILDQNEILCSIRDLSYLESILKWSPHPRIFTEIALIKLCKKEFKTYSDNLQEKIAVLEKKISTGYAALKPLDSSTNLDAGHIASNADMQRNNENSKANAQTINKTRSNPKTSSNSSAESLKLFAKWQDVVNDVKNEGRMALFAYLSTSKAYISGEQLLVALQSKLACVQVQKSENSEILETLVQKHCGQKYRIKCVCEADNFSTSESNKDYTENKLMDIAKKSGIPLSVLDE